MDVELIDTEGSQEGEQTGDLFPRGTWIRATLGGQSWTGQYMGYNSMNGQIVHQVELPCRYVNGELVLDLNNPVVYGMYAKAIRQEPTSYRGEEHDGRSREM